MDSSKSDHRIGKGVLEHEAWEEDSYRPPLWGEIGGA